jgi:hypothetical protein
MELTAVSD